MGRYSNSVPQILDANGDPIVGALKYFFEPGTSTLKTIYSDSAMTLPTLNPQTADASGRYTGDIFMDGTYKEVQQDANGVTLWTKDPVGETVTGQWTGWDSGTTYAIDEVVLGSDGEYYRSLVGSNIGNDPTSSPASWEQLYLGRIWNTNVTYSLGDTVYGSDGFLYRSQINSNSGNDPTADKTNWWPGAEKQVAVIASGTDTYTATYGETAYQTGRDYFIDFTNANTVAAPTLNLDSLGAKTIKKDGADALSVGDIPAGHQAILRYDGTDFILLNPRAVGEEDIVFVQRVDATPNTTYSSMTTVIPIDDTIPQNTEGTEVVTLAITPTDAANVLIIKADLNVSSAAGVVWVAAIFQDSTADALVATVETQNGIDDPQYTHIEHRMVAGTTSSTTFKVRIGPASSTLYLNGDGSGRLMGGVLEGARLSIQEVKP